MMKFILWFGFFLCTASSFVIFKVLIARNLWTVWVCECSLWTDQKDEMVGKTVFAVYFLNNIWYVISVFFFFFFRKHRFRTFVFIFIIDVRVFFERAVWAHKWFLLLKLVMFILEVNILNAESIILPFFFFSKKCIFCVSQLNSRLITLVFFFFQTVFFFEFPGRMTTVACYIKFHCWIPNLVMLIVWLMAGVKFWKVCDFVLSLPSLLSVLFFLRLT